MTDLLLILIGLSQIIMIALMILLLRSIDNPDFSKEDAVLKDAKRKAQDELNKFPPKKH